jgi:glutamine amidotransferase
MVVIVDYGRGNLFSIGQAIRYIGFEPSVTSDAATIERAKYIILPGVGSFGDAMRGLRERKLVEPLLAAADRGIPILGICLGCQLLLSRGEEFGNHHGLGLIPGVVPRLPELRRGDFSGIRIPNVGWRPLKIRPGARSLRGISTGQMVYFVHSYAPRPEMDVHVRATIAINGEDVPVIVQRDNVLGVQFHPEKSGLVGLAFLAGFLRADNAVAYPIETQSV